MITHLYAGILALILLFISMDTIKARRFHKVSIGLGPHNEIATMASAHSNFISYVPILLLLLFFAESSQLISKYIIHLGGLAISIGRIFHYMAFRSLKMNFKWRVMGMKLTLWPLIILGLINIYIYLKTLI